MTDPTERLTEVLGARPRAVRRLGGGSFGRPYAVTTADGRRLFAKVVDRPTDPTPALTPALTQMTSEAWSLERLSRAAAAGGAPVPRLVSVSTDVLVTELVEQAPPSRTSAAAFGAALARTHRFGSPSFGAEVELFLASERLPTGQEATDWPSFHADARLVPFLARAEAAGGIAGSDADAVQRVIETLPALAGPAEHPALLHGDLWSGNVLWTADGATLIDASAYGGHRETDLAMLALFGLPHLDTVLASYDATFPLAPGWRDRVALHQVFPLLLHALLFGGSYGAATGAAARRALAAGPRR